MLEALGAALQLPSTPRFRRTVDAVGALQGTQEDSLVTHISHGADPSTPHRPLQEQEAALTHWLSPGELAAARRAQASLDSSVVASTLDAVAAGTDEIDVWGAALSDMHLSVVLDAVRDSASRSTRALDIGRNAVGPEALASLERLLQTSGVQELKLSGNSIDDVSLARLTLALSHANRGKVGGGGGGGVPSPRGVIARGQLSHRCRG